MNHDGGGRIEAPGSGAAGDGFGDGNQIAGLIEIRPRQSMSTRRSAARDFSVGMLR